MWNNSCDRFFICFCFVFFRAHLLTSLLSYIEPWAGSAQTRTFCWPFGPGVPPLLDFLSSSPTVFDSLCISVGDVGLVGTRSTEAFPCHFCLFVCFFKFLICYTAQCLLSSFTRFPFLHSNLFKFFILRGEWAEVFLWKKKIIILPSAGKSRIMFDIELRLPVIGSSCRFNERPNISDRQMAKKWRLKKQIWKKKNCWTFEKRIE